MEIKTIAACLAFANLCYSLWVCFEHILLGKNRLRDRVWQHDIYVPRSTNPTYWSIDNLFYDMMVFVLVSIAIPHVGGVVFICFRIYSQWYLLHNTSYVSITYQRIRVVLAGATLCGVLSIVT